MNIRTDFWNFTLSGNVIQFNSANISADGVSMLLSNCDITLEELKSATFHQKNNSSYGLDNVCSEAIKSSFDLISEYLLNIVNHIFNTGEYPETWGRGIIAPIYKSGDPNIAKNYRGITIGNILSKIYSQILLNRLNIWAEKYESLSKNQFGFQK